MKATFTVKEVHYSDGTTIIALSLGAVGGADRLGTKATIELAYHSNLPLSPGQLVVMSLEPAAPPEKTGR